MDIINIQFLNKKKEKRTLKDYDSKYYLIINTASKCGLTPQFDGLEEINKEFKNNGLTTIGFPCGQFADQELATADEADEFCKVNYGVTFEIMDKIDVNGENQSPLFKALKETMPDEVDGEIKWNFTKFIIDQKGNPIKRFGPKEEPQVIKSFLATLI